MSRERGGKLPQPDAVLRSICEALTYSLTPPIFTPFAKYFCIKG